MLSRQYAVIRILRIIYACKYSVYRLQFSFSSSHLFRPIIISYRPIYFSYVKNKYFLSSNPMFELKFKHCRAAKTRSPTCSRTTRIFSSASHSQSQFSRYPIKHCLQVIANNEMIVLYTFQCVLYVYFEQMVRMLMCPLN